MDDLLLVSTAALNLMLAFLSKVATGFSEAIGQRILHLMSTSLSADPKATRILTSFQRDPRKHRRAMLDVIRKATSADPRLLEQVRQLVENYASTSGTTIIQLSSGIGNAQAAGPHSSAATDLEIKG